jgi:IS66 C-terminal element
MQVSQCGWCHPWLADLHANAGDRTQHPRRHHGDDTRGGLDMDHISTNPPLTIVSTDPAPMKRMPTIVDNDVLPDMGRMTPRWLWAEKTISLPGPTPAAIYTIVQTARLNDVNPESYLTDILTKIADGHPINRIDELTPWRLAATTVPRPP